MIFSQLRPSLYGPVAYPLSIGESLRFGLSKNLIRRQHVASNTSHLPRIAQPSTWEAIFPQNLRNRTREVFKTSKRRPANPATYFIWIYILIGSQAIKILNVNNDFKSYMRKADLRIDKLREVVSKLQKGEDVDVEKVLGVGDEEQEQEWEAALREIEQEERAWQENRQKRLAVQERREAEQQDASPVSETEASSNTTPDFPQSLPGQALSRPGFY